MSTLSCDVAATATSTSLLWAYQLQRQHYELLKRLQQVEANNIENGSLGKWAVLVDKLENNLRMKETRLASVEAEMVDLRKTLQGFNTVAQAIPKLREDVARNDDLLKACYVKCQNLSSAQTELAANILTLSTQFQQLQSSGVKLERKIFIMENQLENSRNDRIENSTGAMIEDMRKLQQKMCEIEQELRKLVAVLGKLEYNPALPSYSNAKHKIPKSLNDAQNQNPLPHLDPPEDQSSILKFMSGSVLTPSNTPRVSNPTLITAIQSTVGALHKPPVFTPCVTSSRVTRSQVKAVPLKSEVPVCAANEENQERDVQHSSKATGRGNASESKKKTKKRKRLEDIAPLELPVFTLTTTARL